MTAKQEFLNQLNNEDLRLEDRLHLAYGAVISQDFMFFGKEQTIIDWFAQILKKGHMNIKTVLNSLINCLKSDCLLKLCDTIDLSQLVEVFLELYNDTKTRNSKILMNCLFLILRNLGFQRYSRFEVQPMCQAILLTCHITRYITVSKGDTLCSELEDLFECILSIHKITHQRSEFKLYFIEFVLPAVLNFKYNFSQSQTFQHLFEEIVINEDPEVLCEAFKPESSKNIPDHMKALVNLVTKNEDHCVIVLHSVLFEVYTNFCLKKTLKNHLSLFYILTSVAGFHLPLPYDTVFSCGENIALHLSILKTLLSVFQKYNISVSSESEEGALSHFIGIIQKQLISGEYEISSELLLAVQNILNIYPEGVKQILYGFLQHIAFVKKPERKVIILYNRLLQDVIQIFSDSNQLDSFFTLFFNRASLLSKEHDFSKLSVDMVLTSSFFAVLSGKLWSLTGNQLKVIIKCLTKTFSENFISLLEINTLDANFCFLLKMFIKIFCHVLENSSIVVPTKWNIISEDMKNVILAIQRFGIAIMNSNENHYLLEFLQLVRIMCNMELVMNHYIISLSATKILPIIKSKDKTSSLYNLSKSHGFLQPSKWKCVSYFVVESYNKQLKHCWYYLLVQKFIRLKDPEVITFLIENADCEWLWQTMRQISHCVPLRYLELYTNQLFGNSIIDDNFSNKFSEFIHTDFMTNRVFRAAVNLQVMKQMGKSLPDKALSASLVKLIDFHSIINYETDISQDILPNKPVYLNEMAIAMAEIINKSDWNQTSHTLTETTRAVLSRLIDLQMKMNSQFLKTETKRIVCLALIGLSIDLKNEENLRHSVLDHILGFMDGSIAVVSEFLDKRVLLYWLVTVVPVSYPLKKEVTQVTVNKMVYSLETCLHGMSELVQSNGELVCAMLESLIHVCVTKRFENKEEFYGVVKLLISWTFSLTTKPKPTFLRLYTAALTLEYVFFVERRPILLQSLPDYLEILFRNFADIDPNSVAIIDFTLSLKGRIEEDTINKVYHAITKELCKTGMCPLLCYPTTVRAFFESLSSDIFKKVLIEIHKHQQEGLIMEKEISSLSNVCELWTIIVSAHIDKEKSKIRQKMLMKVLSDCQMLLEKDVSKLHPVILQLLRAISASKSVFLVSRLLDPILVILDIIPTDTEANLLPESLAVLNSLINVQTELIFDRIPPFLQRLRKFVRSLVLLSTSEKVKNLVFNNMLTLSMNQVTRIIKTITDQHSKDFARIAPYLIADILNLLVTYSVETELKNELQNCICYLLCICDHHGTKLLQNLLPLPAVELFKITSSMYRKTFKYTGKV